jgi:transcriptional regulator with XRE-family HTH domain
MGSIPQIVTIGYGLLTTVSNKSCNLCNMTFVQWLEIELEKRNWSPSELARRTKLSTAAFSHIFTGKRKPGIDMCRAIAKAFKLPPETVYRQAGLLPPNKEGSPDYDELKYWFEMMTPNEQEEFLAAGRLKVELRKNREKGRLLPDIQPEHS